MRNACSYTWGMWSENIEGEMMISWKSDGFDFSRSYPSSISFCVVVFVIVAFAGDDVSTELGSEGVSRGGADGEEGVVGYGVAAGDFCGVRKIDKIEGKGEAGGEEKGRDEEGRDEEGRDKEAGG